MLLNGYLINRAIMQQKYKQKQTSFQTLVSINKMHELSIRLLEPTINTFDKDNIKEIKVNQKKLNELEKDKEKDKEEKEEKGKDVEKEGNDKEKDKEKDKDKDKDKEKDKEKDYELLDVEDIHIQPKDVKKITIDIPDLKKESDDKEDIPDLKKDAYDEDDIPDLKEDSEDEISKDVKQIGGELGPAIKNVVVSFF